MKHTLLDDGKQRSRNIGYGYADISVDGEYGKTIKLTEDFMEKLCEIIKMTYLSMQQMRLLKQTCISMEVL